MNGARFVADTNFLIAIHEGKLSTEPYLDSVIVISVISEIELLGWHKLSNEDNLLLRALLNDCVMIDLTSDIRKIAIEIKQQIKIKTPDAIIAATSMFLQIPIITADKDFKKISGIELILI